MAPILPSSKLSIEVKPWTKESLRELGVRATALVTERTIALFFENRSQEAKEWGSRLPRIKGAIDRAARLPYETGEGANDIGSELIALMNERSLDRQLNAAIARVFTRRFSETDEELRIRLRDSFPASRDGIARDLLAAARDLAPMGVSGHEVIESVASTLGII